MAKSPFATKRVERYVYPFPLDREEVDGEKIPERFIEANKEVIDPEEVDEGHWLKLVIPRSKGMLDQVADLTQSLTIIGAEGASLRQQVKAGNRGVFELLADSWSFEGREPSGEAFDDLDLWAADWISACLADAMRQGQARASAKKTGTSSCEPDSSEPKSPEPPSAESPST